MEKVGFKLMYFAGPGDVVSSFIDWLSGRETLSETTVTYSSEAFRYCQSKRVKSWFISSCARADGKVSTGFIVENRPKPTWTGDTSWRYHLRDLAYAGSLWLSAVRFRPDALVVDSGTMHWFALPFFRVLGIQVFVTFHNAYHAMGHASAPVRLRDRLISRLDQASFRCVVAGCLAPSAECARQYLSLAGLRAKFTVFVGLLNRQAFAQVLPPAAKSSPRRILFVGRVEASKGVFDLLKACERLADRSTVDFHLDVCGDGGALQELSRRTKESRISSRVTLHGRLGRTELLKVYGSSYFVVVPTRAEFAEGFAMVCAESVACGRPVVLSDVVPAQELLAEACIVFHAGDVGDLESKLLTLLIDGEQYSRLQLNCHVLAEHFFDRRNGFEAAMHRLLEPAAQP